MDKTMKPGRSAALLTLALLGCAAAAQPVEPAGKAPIALVAAMGQDLTLVRQKAGVGSSIDPFSRRSLRLRGDGLNAVMLRGLDRALALQEPDTPRVLLRWQLPEAQQQALDQRPVQERGRLMLEALTQHLRELPQRPQWSRIEALLPVFIRHEVSGMGSKLAGIGIYTQPLGRGGVDLEDEQGQPLLGTGVEAGAGTGDDALNGGRRTINPRTGAHGQATTYIAPFVYFERVTLDAQTLQVLARQRQFDNIKFHDPEVQGRDVSEHLPLAELVRHLTELAERSAYQSVRGKHSEVESSRPRALPAPPQDGTASAPR